MIEGLKATKIEWSGIRVSEVAFGSDKDEIVKIWIRLTKTHRADDKLRFATPINQAREFLIDLPEAFQKGNQ